MRPVSRQHYFCKNHRDTALLPLHRSGGGGGAAAAVRGGCRFAAAAPGVGKLSNAAHGPRALEWNPFAIKSQSWRRPPTPPAPSTSQHMSARLRAAAPIHMECTFSSVRLRQASRDQGVLTSLAGWRTRRKRSGLRACSVCSTVA